MTHLVKPQDFKMEVLEEIIKEPSTKKGMNYAVVMTLADGKSRNEKEIADRVLKVVITASCEICRREGLMKVSKNFNWFTKWTVKLKRMKCPNCNTVWEVGKKPLRHCPVCRLDILGLAEELFPKLKKLKK